MEEAETQSPEDLGVGVGRPLLGELTREPVPPWWRFWEEKRTASCLRGSKSCRWDSVPPRGGCAGWSMRGCIARGDCELEAPSDIVSGSEVMTGLRMGSVFGL